MIGRNYYAQGIAALFIAALVGLGCARAPVMGWQTDPPTTYVLSAGDVRMPFTFTHGDRVRIQVASTLPVSHAIYNGMVPAGSAGFTFLPCAQRSVTAATSECVIPESETKQILVLRDDRESPTTGSTLTSAGMAYFGVKGPAEQMGTPNSVTVTISGWKCIEHCRGQ
ncbi:MAG: hypothetical protein JWO13_823 [Acidobacteriales bacterium]|nr:hypothetical protein [Terriglobales bacterium]